MRDFNRAVLVGDSRTFGKGTVLTVEDLSSYMQVIGKAIPAGSTSFEIAMFFRASGSSVQQLGISTDIRLPSLTEEMKAGELFLDNHLPWSSISSKPLYKFDSQLEDNIVLLKEQSKQRISSNQDYIKHQRQIDVFRRYRNRKELSLNEEKRFKEYLDEAELEEEAERIANQDGDDKKKRASSDVVLDEAVNIAADYAGLFNSKK
jgi:carboxyl-terminal processing protease